MYHSRPSERLLLRMSPLPILRVSPVVLLECEQELTPSVSSTCITTVLRELEIAAEPALAAILKTPWKDLDNVSGRSAYVVDLVSSIKQVAEVVRERVEAKKYIRNFADKAVGWVLALRYVPEG